jgi:hypothetical protein
MIESTLIELTHVFIITTKDLQNILKNVITFHCLLNGGIFISYMLFVKSLN